jgi:hypothetical protein
MKLYEESERIAPLDTRWRSVVSFTLRPLCPRHPLDRRLGGLQRRFGRGGEETKSLLRCHRESNPDRRDGTSVTVPTASGPLYSSNTFSCQKLQMYLCSLEFDTFGSFYEMMSHWLKYTYAVCYRTIRCTHKWFSLSAAADLSDNVPREDLHYYAAFCCSRAEQTSERHCHG